MAGAPKRNPRKICVTRIPQAPTFTKKVVGDTFLHNAAFSLRPSKMSVAVSYMAILHYERTRGHNNAHLPDESHKSNRINHEKKEMCRI